MVNEADEVRGPDIGDPAEDGRGFRRALSQYATGVTVVTASVDGEAGGVTANSFASVSMDPPLVLWSLQKSSQSYQIFTKATHFAVNILASDQIELSQRFAKSGPDKFNSIDCEVGAGQAPILPGVTAVFECKREIEHDGGDHLIMVGRVERFTRHDRPALVFEKGRYAAAIDHPATRIKQEAPDADMPLHSFFVVLLNRAYHSLREAMAEERAREHLDLNESRVLSAALAYPSRSLETLQPLTFLERVAAEDAMTSLLNKGYLELGPGGVLKPSPNGASAMGALLKNTLNVEKNILKGIPEEDLEITERTLRALIGTDAFVKQ